MDQGLPRDPNPQKRIDPGGGRTRRPHAELLNQGSEVGSGAPEDLMNAPQTTPGHPADGPAPTPEPSAERR